jgi:hypothetical protein
VDVIIEDMKSWGAITVDVRIDDMKSWGAVTVDVIIDDMKSWGDVKVDAMMEDMNSWGAVKVDAMMEDMKSCGAVRVEVKMLDVIKEELLINGTYKLDCTILLTDVKLIVDILFAARVEILHVDILASFINELEECRVIRFAAVVASGKACVLTTAHLVDVFGDTVMNP